MLTSSPRVASLCHPSTGFVHFLFLHNMWYHADNNIIAGWARFFVSTAKSSLMERGCRLVQQRWAQKDAPTLHAYLTISGFSQLPQWI